MLQNFRGYYTVSRLGSEKYLILIDLQCLDNFLNEQFPVQSIPAYVSFAVKLLTEGLGFKMLLKSDLKSL